MDIEIINPLNYPGWDELLLTNKNSSFFHTSFWARVLSESYGYEPLYFTAVDNKKLSVLIPLMAVKSFLTGKRDSGAQLITMKEAGSGWCSSTLRSKGPGGSGR